MLSISNVPNLDAAAFDAPALDRLFPTIRATHAPRILLLYGSVRERSFSRLLSEEAAHLLVAMGAETKIFDPRGLPLPDDAPDTHPKVQELRALSQWAEGMVWTSPERHGAMTGIIKSQIDWLPLSLGAAPHSGQDARRDASVGRFAVVQRRESAPRARALDAHDHHSESIVGRQSFSGV